MQIDPADFHWDDRLSPTDYALFRADADRRSRTTMLYVETLDRVPDHQRLRDVMDRASRTVPRLRQHVVAPLLPLGPARWVHDPDFDLDYHLRFVALPGHAGLRELLDLAQREHAAPLDQGRPLWEATVVEGLDIEGTPAAIIWKLSHAVTDGIGGMVLDQMVRSEERDPDPGPMPPIPAPADISPMDLTQEAARRLPRSLVRTSIRRTRRAARTLDRTIREPGAAAQQIGAVVDDVRKLASGPPAPPSPLLARRSLNRRIDALDLPLSDLRAAAKAVDCSVNDAYLAALGNAFGVYHRARGVPVEAIPTGVPINVRADGREGGNQWSAALLALPTGEMAVADRLREVRRQMLTGRSASGLDPMRMIAPALSWMPQPLLAGAGTGSLGIDLQASNVPGHPGQRFIAGCQLTRAVPIGPLPGVAMMATMTSMGGHCYIGINADTASVDGEAFAVDLQDALAEVVALGSTKTPAKKRRTPAKKQTKKRASSARRATS